MFYVGQKLLVEGMDEMIITLPGNFLDPLCLSWWHIMG